MSMIPNFLPVHVKVQGLGFRDIGFRDLGFRVLGLGQLDPQTPLDTFIILPAISS